METRDPPKTARNPEAGDEHVGVTVHRSSPDRLVFVEEGNSDAWIATDTAVDPVE